MTATTINDHNLEVIARTTQWHGIERRTEPAGRRLPERRAQLRPLHTCHAGLASCSLGIVPHCHGKAGA